MANSANRFPKQVQWTEDHAETVGVTQDQRKLARDLNIDWMSMIKLLLELGLQLLPFLLLMKKNKVKGTEKIMKHAKTFKKAQEDKQDPEKAMFPPEEGE